jgi:acetyltransferase-like isoleucine patch superfamily enzyme
VEKNGGRIDIHESALLNSDPSGYHVAMPFETTLIADTPGSLITIGEGCRIHGTYVHAWKKVEIGRNVLIAAGTNIVDSNGHSAAVRYARFRKHFRDQPEAITIGDFVWIGMGCAILKGVEIGECAIVSAGAVVTEPIPPFAVVAGNPAKVVHVLDRDKALPEDYPLDELSQEEGFYIY